MARRLNEIGQVCNELLLVADLPSHSSLPISLLVYLSLELFKLLCQDLKLLLICLPTSIELLLKHLLTHLYSLLLGML